MRVEALGILQLIPGAQERALHRTHQIKMGQIDRTAGFGKPQSELFRHHSTLRSS